MPSPASPERSKVGPALDAASRSALLVRCGGLSCAGLLMQSADEPLEGALVLAPGLLLLSLGEDVDYEDYVDPLRRDASGLADLMPSVTVVMRRGCARSRELGAAKSQPFLAASRAAGRAAAPQPQDAEDLLEVRARLVCAWRWPALAADLHLSELELGQGQPGQPSQGDDKSRDLLSMFLLLRLQPREASKSEGRRRDAFSGQELSSALSAFLRARPVPEVPARGRAVCSACAPLGAPALLGAVSRGVVSGTRGVLTLTDARVAPGGEGAAVFDESLPEAVPFAIVLAPLTWWRGEAVGFTVCVGLRRLLADLQTASAAPAGQRKLHHLDDDVYDLDRRVVLVRSAHMWGSGVLVDKSRRIVLTCAHVLVRDVQVCWGAHSVRAVVLWRSADAVPYDVAVLQLDDLPCVAELRPMALDCKPPRVGEPVLAVGFPLFSGRSGDTDSLLPLVSRGHVAGWWRSASSQILTTCCVQSGVSGGPLLRLLDDGGVSVIGILVCNAQVGCGRDVVVYPHVNFALWADAVAAPVQAFLESGDERALGGLRCDNGNVQRQWNLQPPRMCKL